LNPSGVTFKEAHNFDCVPLFYSIRHYRNITANITAKDRIPSSEDIVNKTERHCKIRQSNIVNKPE